MSGRWADQGILHVLAHGPPACLHMIPWAQVQGLCTSRDVRWQRLEHWLRTRPSDEGGNRQWLCLHLRLGWLACTQALKMWKPSPKSQEQRSSLARRRLNRSCSGRIVQPCARFQAT